MMPNQHRAPLRVEEREAEAHSGSLAALVAAADATGNPTLRNLAIELLAAARERRRDRRQAHAALDRLFTRRTG